MQLFMKKIYKFNSKGVGIISHPFSDNKELT